MPKPTIYLIAGCNGAGKTTFAKEFLPHEVKCLRFYNADEIARGLSPLDPAAGDFKAGRLLLTEVRSSIARRETFALESTLSGKTYVRIFESALARGYELELHYLWLAKPEQAITRVRRRVRLGGHDVPIADIRRRFKRSREHLVKDYLPLATRWVVWDSRGINAKRLATSDDSDIDFCSAADRIMTKRKTNGAKKDAGICRPGRASIRACRTQSARRKSPVWIAYDCVSEGQTRGQENSDCCSMKPALPKPEYRRAGAGGIDSPQASPEGSGAGEQPNQFSEAGAEIYAKA